MATHEEEEEKLLRSAALQTANSILVAQRRAEQELIQAKQALELKTVELAHSLSLMRATLESTTDGILVTDEDGKVTDYNEKYVEMWRIPSEILLLADDRQLREIASKQSKQPELFLARIAGISASMAPESFDLLELTDGRVFERYSKSQRLGNRTVGRVWSFRDITERRRAEEEQRTSEERFRQLWATSTDAIVIINAQRSVEYVNSAVQNVFGFTAEEVLERGMQIFIPERLREAHDRGLQRYLETGIRKLDWRATEATGLHREGHEVPIEISFCHFKEAGQDLFAAFIRDITERKRTEETLQEAKAAAERASKAKDDFLAVLSHELRTPLTPALMAASHLAEHEGLPPELQNEAITIRRNVLLEAQLIDDLLDLTRITRGKVELRFEAVDAHAALRDVFTIYQENIAAKGLKVSIDPDAHQHWVWADPTRLRQVFWNLLNNAVKFTPRDGRIIIRSTNPERDQLRVEVSDTGVGIEPEQIGRIFSAFEQGERTVTRQFGGLGLGLAITRSLIEMHRGSIVVESAGKGKGASFRVSLAAMPEPEAHASGAGDASEGAALSRHFRILLTDDHDDTRRMLSMLLRRRGHEVVEASTVKEAFEFLESSAFELLISDIGLPDGSGHEVMQEARKRHGMRGIALSGFGMEDDLRRSTEAGFDHHLTKPVDFKVLRELVERADR